VDGAEKIPVQPGAALKGSSERTPHDKAGPGTELSASDNSFSKMFLTVN
jgi:hypothetical protein